jgi:hypothetical protein
VEIVDLFLILSFIFSSTSIEIFQDLKFHTKWGDIILNIPRENREILQLKSIPDVFRMMNKIIINHLFKSIIDNILDNFLSSNWIILIGEKKILGKTTFYFKKKTEVRLIFFSSLFISLFFSLSLLPYFIFLGKFHLDDFDFNLWKWESVIK